MGTLRSFIRENRITHDEYRRAVAFLSEVGAPARDAPPLRCVPRVTVDEVENRNRPGTATTIEGPYYVPDAAELAAVRAAAPSGRAGPDPLVLGYRPLRPTARPLPAPSSISGNRTARAATPREHPGGGCVRTSTRTRP